MASLRIRRALGLAAALSLALSGAAVADTISADGDTVQQGVQNPMDLGDVEAGQTLPVDVSFVLACTTTFNHVQGGTTLAIEPWAYLVPGDGWLTSSPASIVVPDTWPGADSACPAGTSLTTATPAHLKVTAPTATGSQELSALYTVDPAAGLASARVGITFTMNVVDPTPADDSPPIIHDVPDSTTVTTYDDGAIVTWPMPTASDDTDPAPVVACSPDSGSTFPLGTTTVTCTATDASGNQASATFDVTVVQVPRLEGVWGQPLDDAMPALVGRAGRTVPLRLDLAADGIAQGPAAIDAPMLSAVALAACTADAAAGPPRDLGAFDWAYGTWQLNLQTGDLGGGCWRLDAQVDGVTVASAVIRLEDGGTAVAASRRH
jgi:hypothetical protein